MTDIDEQARALEGRLDISDRFLFSQERDALKDRQPEIFSEAVAKDLQDAIEGARGRGVLPHRVPARGGPRLRVLAVSSPSPIGDACPWSAKPIDRGPQRRTRTRSPTSPRDGADGDEGGDSVATLNNIATDRPSSCFSDGSGTH
jgi:hypothetical protein